MRAALLLVALLLAGCAGGELSCGLHQAAEVPVAVLGGAPYVLVEANGKLATMILDTGAQVTVFTQRAVERMGLKIDPSLTMTVSGVGGSAKSWPAVATQFGMDRIALPPQRVMVLPYGLPPAGTEEVDGLLGVDVLSRFEIDLDLPRRRVGLYSGHACQGEPLPVAGMEPLEATEMSRGRLTGMLRLDGTPMRALLDTGAMASVVSLPAMERAGTPRAALARDQPLQLHGVGPQSALAWLHRFARLELAGETSLRPLLQVTALPDATPDLPGLDQAGSFDVIIGADYLASHRLWLAYGRGKVFYQRPGTGPIATRD